MPLCPVNVMRSNLPSWHRMQPLKDSFTDIAETNWEEGEGRIPRQGPANDYQQDSGCRKRGEFAACHKGKQEKVVLSQSGSLLPSVRGLSDFGSVPESKHAATVRRLKASCLVFPSSGCEDVNGKVFEIKFCLLRTTLNRIMYAIAAYVRS